MDWYAVAVTDIASFTPPSAKRLILSLLSAPDLDEISARQCARWGALFSIEAAAMRVAVGRMVKEDLLTTVRRGVYSIGPRGRPLSDKARSWVAAEARVGPWDGRWLLVYTGHLGRRNKTTLRNRERALRLEGFAPLEQGIWCRPANYREPAAATRDRLLTLGLDVSAAVMRADRLLGFSASPESLWPRSDLEKSYARLTSAMQQSMRHLGSLSDEAAARETFVIGEAVIRQVNSDPLLPEEMIDADARRHMHATMVTYDGVGRGAWARFQTTA